MEIKTNIWGVEETVSIDKILSAFSNRLRRTSWLCQGRVNDSKDSVAELRAVVPNIVNDLEFKWLVTGTRLYCILTIFRKESR